jgi:hypothetical protein
MNDLFRVLDSFSLILFLAGAIGALVSCLIKDNCIVLPKKIGGVLNLGTLGGLIIGGFAGIILDGSLFTACMGGFIGRDIILAFAEKQKSKLCTDEIKKEEENKIGAEVQPETVV